MAFFSSINLHCQVIARITNKNIYVNSSCEEKAHVKYSVTIHKIRATCRALQTSDLPKLCISGSQPGRGEGEQCWQPMEIF